MKELHGFSRHPRTFIHSFERLTDQKYEKYPELVHSDRVHYVVLACEEGGRWGPDVFSVVEDLVKLKVAPLHSLIMGLALVCAGLLSCSSSFWRACSCSLRCLFAPLGLELRPYNLDRPRVHPRRANPESP